MTPVIRPATPADAGLVHRFVVELAAYEKLDDRVRSTALDLAEALFGPQPRVFCELAELEGRPAGLALWFYSYSTFDGRAGIFLEDLYVAPAARRRGVGRALLRKLAERCVAEGLSRLSWAVLDWNQPAIQFYRSLGAEMTPTWVGCQLAGEPLAALGSGP